MKWNLTKSTYSYIFHLHNKILILWKKFMKRKKNINSLDKHIYSHAERSKEIHALNEGTGGFEKTPFQFLCSLAWKISSKYSLQINTYTNQKGQSIIQIYNLAEAVEPHMLDLATIMVLEFTHKTHTYIYIGRDSPKPCSHWFEVVLCLCSHLLFLFYEWDI